MMRGVQALKRSVSQSDGLAYKSRRLKHERLSPDKVLDRFSEAIFPVTKVVGGGREDQRWQIDLIDFSKRIAKLNNQHKYVLIVVDLYNRGAFTQPLQRKTAPATLEAFKKIIRKNDGKMPNEITVDLGTEYALLETEIADAGGVLRRKKRPCCKHACCRQ